MNLIVILRQCAVCVAALAFLVFRLFANSTDFDGNGTPDLLYFNKATRIPYVWFMTNGTAFVRSAPITDGGSPLQADANYKIIDTGYFDKNDTNRLGILWQSLADYSLVVWLLTNSDHTEFDTAMYFDTVPAWGWKAMAVGDFNTDGKSDIAF